MVNIGRPRNSDQHFEKADSWMTEVCTSVAGPGTVLLAGRLARVAGGEKVNCGMEMSFCSLKSAFIPVEDGWGNKLTIVALTLKFLRKACSKTRCQ